MVVDGATFLDHLPLGHAVSWWEKEQGSSLGSGAKALVFRTGGTTLGEGLTPYLAPPADTAPTHSRRGCALGSPPHNARRASTVCRPLGQLARCSRGAGLPAQSLEHLYLGVRWMQHLEPKLPFSFPITTDLTPLHTYTHLDPLSPTARLELPQTHGHTHLEAP